jgi:hypothetical protein
MPHVQAPLAFDFRFLDRIDRICETLRRFVGVQKTISEPYRKLAELDKRN